MMNEVSVSDKNSVRKRVKDLVGQVECQSRLTYDQSIASNLIALLNDLLEEKNTVGAFFPIGHEPRFGLNQLSDSFVLGFPVLRGDEMIFCKGDQAAIQNEKNWDYFLDAKQSESDERIQVCQDINALLVPGVAFHGKNKKRLGRGKGYYDKYLSKRTRHFYTIGLCYELQVIEELPFLDHDMPVDYIVTEQKVYR
ncbi:5-formyltetrahydrofolate cyclo-ligase [Bacteriovoracaceae bacterium]|nr:5-formyltetrahydrofolate cyclo-ligase [Bacteriovoracaceae bacterium]